jgi:hypothetical protein
MRAQLSRWHGALFFAAGAAGLLSILHGELVVGPEAGNDLAGTMNVLLYQGGNILASLGILGLGALLRDGGGRLGRVGAIAATLCGAAASLAAIGGFVQLAHASLGEALVTIGAILVFLLIGVAAILLGLAARRGGRSVGTWALLIAAGVLVGPLFLLNPGFNSPFLLREWPLLLGMLAWLALGALLLNRRERTSDRTAPVAA